MKNVKTNIDKDGILHITVDTKQTFGLSKSGKTETIASTQGNVDVDDSGIFVGLNVYRYPDAK